MDARRTWNIPRFTAELGLQTREQDAARVQSVVVPAMGRPVPILRPPSLVGDCQTVCFVGTDGRMHCTNCCDNGHGGVDCGSLGPARWVPPRQLNSVWHCGFFSEFWPLRRVYELAIRHWSVGVFATAIIAGGDRHVAGSHGGRAARVAPREARLAHAGAVRFRAPSMDVLPVQDYIESTRALQVVRATKVICLASALVFTLSWIWSLKIFPRTVPHFVLTIDQKPWYLVAMRQGSKSSVVARKINTIANHRTQ